MRCHRTTLLLLVSAAVLLVPASAAAVRPPVATGGAGSRPNILFFLADDLGAGEVEAFYPGHKTVTPHGSIPTPRLNALAAEGMLLRNAYAGAPVCAPSRANLMTGLHPGHSQVRGNRNVNGHDFPIGQDGPTMTLPKLLKQANYSTAMIGKWGLGWLNTTGAPLINGWDYYYGQLDQAAAHCLYPQFMWENDKQVHFPLNSDAQNPPTRQNCMAHPEKCSYVQDLFLDKTYAWLDAHHSANNQAEQAGEQTNPFFLYLSYVLPHAGGWVGQAETGEPVPNNFQFGARSSWPTVEQDHAAMIQYYIDRYLGDVLDKLETLGMRDDTLVIFASDNGAHNEGGHDYRFFNSSGQFRGFKRSMYEGGVRSPSIVSWRGVTPPGSSSAALTAFWDWMPTFAELIDVPLTQHTDGVSLLPVLRGESQPAPHDFLYFEFCTSQKPFSPLPGFGQSVRRGDWKLVRFNVSQSWQLYNLRSDVGETNDVAHQQPNLVAKLAAIAREQHTDDKWWPVSSCIPSAHAPGGLDMSHEDNSWMLVDPIDQQPEWQPQQQAHEQQGQQQPTKRHHVHRQSGK
jgi:arylsulfatase A-like enzyme